MFKRMILALALILSFGVVNASAYEKVYPTSEYKIVGLSASKEIKKPVQLVMENKKNGKRTMLETDFALADLKQAMKALTLISDACQREATINVNSYEGLVRCNTTFFDTLLYKNGVATYYYNKEIDVLYTPEVEEAEMRNPRVIHALERINEIVAKQKEENKKLPRNGFSKNLLNY